MREGLLEIFQETYKELRPASAIPELTIEFFAFANINNTIRLREGKLLVRLSDLLEGAPDAVLRAIAHILLAKMYRRPIERDRRRVERLELVRNRRRLGRDVNRLVRATVAAAGRGLRAALTATGATPE